MLRKLRLEMLKAKRFGCHKILEEDKNYGTIRCGEPFAEDGDLEIVKRCDKCTKKQINTEHKIEKLQKIIDKKGY